MGITNGGGPPTSDVKCAKVAAAIISSPTMSHAARALGMPIATLWRMASKPEVAALLSSIGAQVMETSAVKLQAATGAAVALLHRIVTDPNERVWPRLTAARTILEMATRVMAAKAMAEGHGACADGNEFEDPIPPDFYREIEAPEPLGEEGVEVQEGGKPEEGAQ